MGDGPKETVPVAKQHARADAKRAASEQACVYVETLSVVKDNQLTQDEIRTISATVLQVIKDPISIEIINNAENKDDIIQFCCHITVIVDTENVQAQIDKGRDKLDEAVQRIKELEEANQRLMAENKSLKERYKVADESERKEISQQFKLNEEKFTALQLTEQVEKCYTQRNYTGAIDALTKAIEIDPNYSNAWAWLAAVYNDFGNTSKAMELNLKAIDLDPKNALAWNNLGVTYSHLGNIDKFIEYYEKAMTLDKKLKYPWSNLGNVYLNLGDYDKALSYCNKAIELFPNYSHAWNNLADIYAHMGNFRKAREYYEKAI